MFIKLLLGPRHYFILLSPQLYVIDTIKKTYNSQMRNWVLKKVLPKVLLLVDELVRMGV